MNRDLALDLATAKRSFQLTGLMLAFTFSSFGSSMTLTDVTTASGTLGPTPFTNDLVTISTVGDTSDIATFTGGYSLNDSSASITIAGLGTFQFITATRDFVNDSIQEVGFSLPGNPGYDLIGAPINSAFSSWDMLTSIGPITGEGLMGIAQWGFQPVLTTGGVLVLDDDQSANITFSAQVAPLDPLYTGSQAPESGTLLLLAAGLFGLGGMAKQKTAR